MTNKRRDDAMERVLYRMEKMENVRIAKSDGEYAVGYDCHDNAIYIVNIYNNVEEIEEMNDKEIDIMIEDNMVEAE